MGILLNAELASLLNKKTKKKKKNNRETHETNLRYVWGKVVSCFGLTIFLLGPSRDGFPPLPVSISWAGIRSRRLRGLRLHPGRRLRGHRLRERHVQLARPPKDPKKIGKI